MSAPTGAVAGSGLRPLPQRADVVVVGAGIAGLCTAYELARRGVEVVVLERDQPWSDASGANAGTLSLQVKRPETWDLTRLAIERWATLGPELGVDLGFAQPGGLRVATTERERAMLTRAVEAQRAHGLDVTLLQRREAHARAPWLGPAVSAAAWCPTDALSSPLLVGPALVAAVRRLGVGVHPCAEVAAIRGGPAGSRLITARGEVRARRVVVAAGAWAGRVAAMLGHPLPVQVDVNMLTVTARMPPLLDCVVTHVGGVLSLKQYANGTCVIGGGWQGRGGIETGERALDHERFLHNMRFAHQVVPGLGAAHVVRAWAGFEGVAPDALPLLGGLPGRDDVWVVACARGGYSQGPALGLVAAAQVRGERPPLAVAAFAPGRLRSAAAVA
ncbi:MAG: FAD-binding oxidoreductase [Chromatiales bacterium]|nr:FAD-binding oxidoreductase [Chromatiales bacterium]